MAKKYPIGYIKDEKKVRAGKIRHVTGITVNGRYAPKEFIKILSDAAILTGIEPTKEKLKTFFLQNEKQFTKVYFQPIHKNSKEIEKIIEDLDGYKGKILLNDEPISYENLSLELRLLEQYFKVNHNAVSVFFRPEIFRVGKTNIKIPDIDEIDERFNDGEEITDIADSYGIGLIISDQKSTSATYERHFEGKTETLHKKAETLKRYKKLEYQRAYRAKKKAAAKKNIKKRKK